MANSDIEQLSIDTIRTLSVDAVQQANAGHPGTAMALAPLSYLIYTKHLRHSPSHPGWQNRDRFVLSAGHAVVLQYSTLHLTGYNLALERLGVTPAPAPLARTLAPREDRADAHRLARKRQRNLQREAP